MAPLRANEKLETIKRLCQRINEIMFHSDNKNIILMKLAKILAFCQ